MKQYLRRATSYEGLPETASLRNRLQSGRRQGWPYCSTDQGDVLFHLARSVGEQDALQVGFATGSTAAYILSGLRSGCLTSIDSDHDHFERAGEALVNELGFAARHRLIEQDSVQALPALSEADTNFGLVFLDGWKSFDRLWVDTFYCARLLSCGGYLVFDDVRMPSVRKCLSLLQRYYLFAQENHYDYVGGWRLRLWHLLTERSWHPPYAVLRKTAAIDETDAGRQYDFWRTF